MLYNLWRKKPKCETLNSVYKNDLKILDKVIKDEQGKSKQEKEKRMTH